MLFTFISKRVKEKKIDTTQSNCNYNLKGITM